MSLFAFRMVISGIQPRRRGSNSRHRRQQREATIHGDDDKKRVSRFSLRHIRVPAGRMIKLLLLFVSLLVCGLLQTLAAAKASRIRADFPRIIISSYPFDEFEPISEINNLSSHWPSLDPRYPVFLKPQHKDKWYEKNRKKLDDEDTGCPFIADWQRTIPNPTCNTLHEVGFHITVEENPIKYRLEYLDEGGFKQVWLPLLENGDPAEFVLKITIFDDNDFSEDDLMGDQQDGLVMERNTASNHVLSMYSYCNYSNLVERATGTVSRWIKKKSKTAKPIELLRVANMVAQGVKDMHMYEPDSEGNLLPTMASADIKASQFLETSPGIFKVNDFNRARFLTSKKPNTICPFYMPGIKHNGSTMRAPEEYLDNGAQSDKIDVFSLGSLLYHILVGHEPFKKLKFKDAIRNIVKGIQPELPDVTDPSLAVIKKAIEMCRQQDAKDRPWSRDVAEFLQKALNEQEAAISREI